MISFSWISIFLLAPGIISAVTNTHQDVIVVGSGESRYLEECKQSFIPYKNYFLRGVKEEFFVTYNETSEADCLKYCCLEKHFECSSFSYFPALKVCYIMNLTKHDDVAQLVYFKGITHYDKAVPTESTPTVNDTTNAITTSPFTTSTPSEKTPRATTASAETFQSTTVETKLETAREQTLPTTAATITSSLHDVTTQSLVKQSEESTEAPETEATKFPKILTDAAPTMAETVTKDKDPGPPIILGNEEFSKHPDDFTAFAPGSPPSQPQCAGICQNGGTCKFINNRINVKERAHESEVECVCMPGYDGEFCEKKSKAEAQVGNGNEADGTAAGIPTYGIVVAVLGFFIFSLIVGVLAVYVIYRKKTGQYRVKEQRERWNKRTKKNEARRSHSFLFPDQRSTIGSELNFPDILDSSGTLSTTTSV